MEILVHNGPGDEIPLTMDNVSFKEMADIMRKMQMGGRFIKLVNILHGLPEYANAQKLLDLGCGTGASNDAWNSVRCHRNGGCY